MFPKTHASSAARIFFAAVQSFLRLRSFSWHDFPRSKAHANMSSHYLQGQGNFISKEVNPLTHMISLAIPIINLGMKPPWPSR